ncbi:hypothetical protein EV183_003677 [Coemansia sp. RSA 2336]|nr:hypothetical protein EV183_003677 [Coemansia sp. RSA 2336]
MNSNVISLVQFMLLAMTMVSGQQTGALQPMSLGVQRMSTFTPIRLIQPQTPEQRQAIDNLVQELQRISPQLFSTAGQSNNQQLAIALPSNPQAAGAQPAQQTGAAPQAVQFPQASQQPVTQEQQPVTPQQPVAQQQQPVAQVQPAQQVPPAQPTPQASAPQVAPQVAPQELPSQEQPSQEQPSQEQTLQAPEPAPTPEQPATASSPEVDQETSSDPTDNEIPLSFALNALFHTASSREDTSDTLPFGLHFDTSSTELDGLESESSMSASTLDEWAGLDSSAATPAMSLALLGITLTVICGL